MKLLEKLFGKKQSKEKPPLDVNIEAINMIKEITNNKDVHESIRTPLFTLLSSAALSPDALLGFSYLCQLYYSEVLKRYAPIKETPVATEEKRVLH